MRLICTANNAIFSSAPAVAKQSKDYTTQSCSSVYPGTGVSIACVHDNGRIGLIEELHLGGAHVQLSECTRSLLRSEGLLNRSWTSKVLDGEEVSGFQSRWS